MGRPRKEQQAEGTQPVAFEAIVKNEGFVAEINGRKYYRLDNEIPGWNPKETSWDSIEREILSTLQTVQTLAQYTLALREIGKQCIGVEGIYDQYNKAEVSGNVFSDLNRIAFEFRRQVNETNNGLQCSYSRLMNCLTLKGNDYKPFDFGQF